MNNYIITLEIVLCINYILIKYTTNIFILNK